MGLVLSNPLGIATIDEEISQCISYLTHLDMIKQIPDGLYKNVAEARYQIEKDTHLKKEHKKILFDKLDMSIQ